jgi:hypothetical protein
MKRVVLPSLSRNRALATSASLMMFTFFGVTSVAAQAADVTVQATVEECVVSISPAGPLVMSGPPSLAGNDYVFQEVGAISVNWNAGAYDCGGTLHAERTAVTKDSEAIAGTSVTLNYGSGNMAVVTDQTVEVATTAGMGAGDTANFDVEMTIPISAGAGTYSSTLTFTFVPGFAAGP